MRSTSPLRYPGGKARLSAYVALLLRENDLVGCDYVEPYAGGAGLALNLLVREYVRRIHLNDLDIALYSFWKSVVEEPEAFCKKLWDPPVPQAQWRVQKQIQENPAEASQLELGFSTFFLNRTNRSGIIRGGGMIGGAKQTGKWLIDARYTKPNLVKQINQIASYASRIRLYNQDAEVFLKTSVAELRKKTFVYCDPPYFEKGPGLYRSAYRAEDHASVARTVQRNVKHSWMVSYDDKPQVRDLYSKRRQIYYGLQYSAAQVYTGGELIAFADTMTIPDGITPTDATW